MNTLFLSIYHKMTLQNSVIPVAVIRGGRIFQLALIILNMEFYWSNDSHGRTRAGMKL